jgi:succinyl-CoA synthetase beta subunit
MHLHEFQAKQLFAEYGIPVPPGAPAQSASAALEIARALGGDQWIVKAQVHAGGRGKAGGVRAVAGPDELAVAADAMLGSRLTTAQTGTQGLPVNWVLVEQPVAVAREIYLGIVVDRGRENIVVMASAAGGMDIEQVSREQPAALLTLAVSPLLGL